MTSATDEQVVATFDALDYHEILDHNWGTCGRDCTANWNVNDETYINGVMMTLDFDYMMGYLIQAVDRTSSNCRYITRLQRHGRRQDGTFDGEWERAPIPEHEFFSKCVRQVDICQWAAVSIYRMLDRSGG